MITFDQMDEAAVERLPLVSCILPTRNRSQLLRRAIQYYERQTYPNRELLILEDGDEDMTAELAERPSVHYMRSDKILSIGAKRNILCESARGDIIAHWDDDDWYSSTRLGAQVLPILNADSDLTAFSSCVFYEIATRTFWTCDPSVFRRMFVGNVHSGTLVYRRALFGKEIRFPDRSKAEDALFLHRCHVHGARISGIPGSAHFVYVRHPGATWHFQCGHHVDSRGWASVEPPEMPMEDRTFFASL